MGRALVCTLHLESEALVPLPDLNAPLAPYFAIRSIPAIASLRSSSTSSFAEIVTPFDRDQAAHVRCRSPSEQRSRLSRQREVVQREKGGHQSGREENLGSHLHHLIFMLQLSFERPTQKHTHTRPQLEPSNSWIFKC